MVSVCLIFCRLSWGGTLSLCSVFVMDLAKKQENVFRWCNNLYLCAKIYNNTKKLDCDEKNYLFFNVYVVCFRFESK